jgi:adenosylmethionine-8-amino-7-oxononanoate aminotransferase
MAASGISFYTQAFQGMFIDVVRIPVPVKGQEQVSFDALKNVIENHNCAGFIFEPLVQGAAGMVMYEPEVYGRAIRS